MSLIPMEIAIIRMQLWREEVIFVIVIQERFGFGVGMGIIEKQVARRSRKHRTNFISYPLPVILFDYRLHNPQGLQFTDMLFQERQ